MANKLTTRIVRCGACGADREMVDGAFLRRLRERKSISLRAMATRIGKSAPYLCDIELNRRNATADIVAAYRGL